MKQEVQFLTQLINTLDEAEIKLEEAYVHNNIERFNQIKKFILRIQAQIAEVLK